MTPNFKKINFSSIKIKNQSSKSQLEVNTFRHRIKLANTFIKEDNFTHFILVNFTTNNLLLS